jgi:hypothetical protein
MNNVILRWLGTSALALAVGTFAVAADKPKPRLPASDRPAPAAEGHRRLADEQIDYVPPEGWAESPKNHTATRDAFVAKGGQAMMSIEVLPADQKIAPDMAASMVKKMKQMRQAASQKSVMEPTVEKDDRFIVRIHEKYQVKDKVADQLHLYRQVGSRVVLVVTNSLAGEDGAKAHHELGEKVAQSAEFVKK